VIGERHDHLIPLKGATSNLCHGDSGGPSLSKSSDGVWHLIGVTSYLAVDWRRRIFHWTNECAASATTYAVSVDAYAAWIDEAIRVLDRRNP
jgi:hypothetical protein